MGELSLYMRALTALEEIKTRRDRDEGHDPEAEHSDADKVLCDFLRGLGYGELVDKYNEIEKWYA